MLTLTPRTCCFLGMIVIRAENKLETSPALLTARRRFPFELKLKTVFATQTHVSKEQYKSHESSSHLKLKLFRTEACERPSS